MDPFRSPQQRKEKTFIKEHLISRFQTECVFNHFCLQAVRGRRNFFATVLVATFLLSKGNLRINSFGCSGLFSENPGIFWKVQTDTHSQTHSTSAAFCQMSLQKTQQIISNTLNLHTRNSFYNCKKMLQLYTSVMENCTFSAGNVCTIKC